MMRPTLVELLQADTSKLIEAELRLHVARLREWQKMDFGQMLVAEAGSSAQHLIRLPASAKIPTIILQMSDASRPQAIFMESLRPIWDRLTLLAGANVRLFLLLCCIPMAMWGATTDSATVATKQTGTVAAEAKDKPQGESPSVNSDAATTKSNEKAKGDPQIGKAAAPALSWSQIIHHIVYYLGTTVVGALTVYFLFWFKRSLDSGAPPAMETNWGGIGGGFSGWQINGSLALLVTSVVLVITFCSMILAGPGGTAEKEQPLLPAVNTAKDATAK